MASRSSMINRPDPQEILEVPLGQKKVTVELDSRVDKCIFVNFQREDHTLGHLISKQLLRDPAVTFAGYRNPHPLEPTIELRVQTDQTSNPFFSTHNALLVLQNEVSSLRTQFDQQLRSFSH